MILRDAAWWMFFRQILSPGLNANLSWMFSHSGLALVCVWRVVRPCWKSEAFISWRWSEKPTAVEKMFKIIHTVVENTWKLMKKVWFLLTNEKSSWLLCNQCTADQSPGVNVWEWMSYCLCWKAAQTVGDNPSDLMSEMPDKLFWQSISAGTFTRL